jgi:hypothetical protein
VRWYGPFLKLIYYFSLLIMILFVSKWLKPFNFDTFFIEYGALFSPFQFLTWILPLCCSSPKRTIVWGFTLICFALTTSFLGMLLGASSSFSIYFVIKALSTSIKSQCSSILVHKVGPWLCFSIFLPKGLEDFS